MFQIGTLSFLRRSTLIGNSHEFPQHFVSTIVLQVTGAPCLSPYISSQLTDLRSSVASLRSVLSPVDVSMLCLAYAMAESLRIHMRASLRPTAAATISLAIGYWIWSSTLHLLVHVHYHSGFSSPADPSLCRQVSGTLPAAFRRHARL